MVYVKASKFVHGESIAPMENTEQELSERKAKLTPASSLSRVPNKVPRVRN